MNILLLSQFYPPIVGGEERHVQNLGIALIKLGHRVVVATLWYPGAKSFEIESGVRIHRIRGTMQRLPGVFAESERRHAPPFPDPELMMGLKRIINEEKPQIVHAHNWLVDSYLPLKAWSKVPLVVTLHDYSLICAKKNFMYNGEPCTGPGWKKCWTCAGQHYGTLKSTVTLLGNFASGALARKLVDRFIVVSHAVAKHNQLTEYEVIHNFVPDDIGVLAPILDPRIEQLPREPFILFVGDLMHLKGVDVLVRAYARINNLPPLVLIGRRCPDTPAVMPPNVHVFDPWPHTAIMQAWSRCLFGVLPSVGLEACATVIIEGMAMGKPFVATRVGGTPDLLNEQTGILVPPDNTNLLAKAIQLLSSDPERITRMGKASLARAEQLKATAVVAQIERLYHTLLRNT